jgi:hypothetical protein
MISFNQFDMTRYRIITQRQLSVVIKPYYLELVNHRKTSADIALIKMNRHFSDMFGTSTSTSICGVECRHSDDSFHFNAFLLLFSSKIHFCCKLSQKYRCCRYVRVETWVWGRRREKKKKFLRFCFVGVYLDKFSFVSLEK